MEKKRESVIVCGFIADRQSVQSHTHVWPLIKDHFGIFQMFHKPKQS